MRVTMLVRTLAMMRGGGETRHLAWARELSALGVHVDLLTAGTLTGQPRIPVRAPHTTILRTPYLRDFVYRFQKRRGFGRLTMAAMRLDDEWFCRAAWRHIEKQATAPDLVHAHALHQAARLRRNGIPVVINLPGEPNARDARDLADANALVGDGWAAATLPKQIGLPIERVPKGVDSQMFNPQGPDLRSTLNLEGKRVVLTIARLVPIKNVTLLVEAFARVRELLAAAHLVVVGEGPEGQALRHRAIALGCADSVTFVGSVPHEQTPLYYRSADLFVLSSDFDNSPNVLLEAMASGLPIVATETGGVHEFVDGRTGGLVVPRRDAEALARAIVSLLPPDAGRTAGAHNRLKATSEYSWRASAIRLLDVYRRVVDGRATAA